jgi:putative peptidoglycan lipid II flippase
MLVVWFASRAGYCGVDARLRQSVIRLAAAGIVLGVALWLSRNPVLKIASHWPALKEEIALIIFIVVGMVIYGGAIVLMFGKRWFGAFRAR